MFNKEDFELPMEKMLKLRIINDEVDNCHDIDVLRHSLKSCSESLLRFQHLLAKTLEGTIRKELENVSPETAKILEDI